MKMEGPKKVNKMRNWIAAAIGLTGASATAAEAQQMASLEPVTFNASTSEQGQFASIPEGTAFTADAASFVDANPLADIPRPFAEPHNWDEYQEADIPPQRPEDSPTRWNDAVERFSGDNPVTVEVGGVQAGVVEVSGKTVPGIAINQDF